MVIDIEGKMRERFYAWAGEYIETVDGGDLRENTPEYIFMFLVCNQVFSLDELRRELDERKIIVHENHFKTAETWINGYMEKYPAEEKK